MKPEIIIRKATMKDVPEIVKMWKEFMSFHENLPANINAYKEKRKDAAKIWEKYLRKTIRSRNSTVNIAVIGEKLVGYSMLSIKKNPPIFKTQKVGYFGDIFVKKEYRGMGVSSMLRNEGIEWFKKSNLKFMSLMVNPHNKHAQKVYKKWGFFDWHIEMRRRV